MKKFTAILGLLVLVGVGARAQSTPNWTLHYVPSPAEWNSLWGSKADYANLQNEIARAEIAEAAKAAINSAGHIASAALPSLITQRAPLPSDDTTQGYAIGANWRDGLGTYYQNVDPTAGLANWTPMPTPPLPLDVIGLTTTAATVNAGGSGYVVGDTVNLAHGTMLTVATVSAGAVATANVTSPNYYGCVSGSTVTAEAQGATSGAGTGATFNLTVAHPYARATRLLTKCYSGTALTAVRPDTSATQAVGFLPSGALDEQSLLSFAAGLPAVRVSVLNDQGGTAQNATAASPTMPAVFFGRRLGNALSVMLDGHPLGTDGGVADTYMSLPAGETVAPANVTIAAIAGSETIGHQEGVISVGSNSSNVELSEFGIIPPTGHAFQFGNASTANTLLYNGSPFRDGANLIMATATGAGRTLTINDQTATDSVIGATGSVSGGLLGLTGNGYGHQASGYTDEVADIEEPRALTSAEQAALSNSLDYWFNVTPQPRAAILVVGDSHNDGGGAVYQQSWPRQMMQMLNRPDVTMVNQSRWGDSLADQIATYFPAVGAPALASAAGTEFTKIVIGGNCYNDYNGSYTAAQCYASYQALGTLVHAANAKFICEIDVLRNASNPENTVMAAAAALLRQSSALVANGGPCDAVLDFGEIPEFASINGPWPVPDFNSGTGGDGGVHLTAQGQARQAAFAVPVVAPMLP